MDISQDYRSYFANSPIGLWKTKAADGQFLMANLSCAKILGYSSVEELLKLKSSELYINGDRKHLLEEIQTKGSVHDYELQVVRGDGKKIWLSVSAKMEGGYIEGSIEDISHRKENQERLEACCISESNKLNELQQGIKKKIKEISVSIISDRHSL